MGPGSKTRTGGFTVIEVLVSIALLSVIVLVVLMPLTGFFGLTRRSNQQVNATQIAQRNLEVVRGDWLSVANYDQTCVLSPLPEPPTGVEVQVEVARLDHEANPGEASGLSANCEGPPDDEKVLMKRVRVTVRTGEAQSSFSLDVARP